MAIKPAINPGVAVADKTATKAGAVNFLGGGTPLGASVVSSAANKIVGFQRGASAVAPKPPDLGSIIQTLSSNILSNVQNSFESANKNIQQFITNNFAERLGEFRGKVEEVISNPPSKILQNFLSLYRQAIDYIRFLGDRRNIKRLGDNLKALQDVFSESFQVATIIRKTINKIVKQLSNLPKSNSGPGGLNLDIKVPGGPLRKSMPSKRNMMKMGLMGAGLVGAGALGSQVVSGMMDAGGEKIEPTSTDFSGMIPASVMDQFSQILDRFDKAIKFLSEGKSQQSQGSAPGGMPSAPAESPGGSPGGSPGSPGTTGDVSGITSDSAEEARIAAALVTEGGGGTAATDILQVAANRIASGRYQSNYTDVFAADGQFQGVFDNPRGGTQGFRNIKNIADAAAWAGVSEDVIKSRIADMRNPQLRADSAQFVGGALEFRAAPNYYTSRGLVRGEMGSDGRFYNSSWRGGAGDNQFLKDPNKDPMISGPAAVNYAGMTSPARTTTEQVSTPPPAQVSPATTQSMVQSRLATSVSQVPPQQAPEIQIIPLDMGNTQNVNKAISQATGSGSPVMSNGGVTVPFLSSSNDDNSYTMFTKTVYNILD